ncbi:MAG: hypothetical protein QF464_24305, partial [Myxococcota bacterium]|nr:hypothetical protein [Myxococcota bacterium]
LLGFAGIDLDIDSTVASAVEGGDITVVLEALGLDSVVDDDDIGLNGYVAYMDGDSLLIQPSSLDETTGLAVINFNAGTIDGGFAEIGPDDFSATLPIAGINVNLAINQARGTADVHQDDGSFAMEDGKLGGLIPFAEVVNMINDIAADCECLDLNGGGMLTLVDEDELECSDALGAANITCSGADSAICNTLADVGNNGLACSIGTGMVSPDIDTDFNGKNDHFSIGVRFTGVAASIDGVGEDQPADGCSDCTGGGGPLNGLAHLALFVMLFAAVT